MPSHPNRSKKNPSAARNPTTAEIRQAREAAKLTQTEAAELIYCTLRGWQDWESGARRMHPAFWELFLLRSESAGACAVILEHVKRLRALGIATEISWTCEPRETTDENGPPFGGFRTQEPGLELVVTIRPAT